MNILSFYDKEKQQDKSIIHQQLTLNFLDHICDQCLKQFTSKYGLDYHINMYHSNQSIFCSNCNLTFRSHRALKNHQQRFHVIYSEQLSNYNSISSYLFVPFSTQQFSLMTKNACEQKQLPLGDLSSKLFQCYQCLLSFPTLNALKYHQVNQHEQYEYQICQKILYDIILQIDENLKTNDDDDNEIQSMKFLLAKQSSYFGLIDKQLAQESSLIKHEHHRFIFPSCEHQNRTCANLCLKNLSSYNKLIQNYSYKIPIIPKGNPFAQGSIVSSNSLINSSIISTKENFNSNKKSSSLKQIKSSSSSQSKRKLSEQSIISTDQSSLSPSKKPSHSYTRSLSSMSSTSSTSTRSSSKNSRQQQSIISLKRSVSPNITLAVERSSEKRRRQREQRKTKALELLSSTTTKIHNDNIEQENDDDDDDDDIISNKSKKPKQRQSSNSSVEYVQVINNEQPSISSLNNIENLKLKSSSNDEEITICHSSQSVKKTKVNGVHKINNHQTSDYDEHIRVRCKICGDILDGRSQFSKHVLTMHSHLLKSNLSDIKQQQTTMVYTV